MMQSSIKTMQQVILNMQGDVCEAWSSVNQRRINLRQAPKSFNQVPDEILISTARGEKVVKTMSDRNPRNALAEKERANFNRLLLEAIDETLSCLGKSSKAATYHQLETAFKIKKEEIPDRIDDFSRALESLFGLGAKLLEIMFMKNLHAKVKVSGESVSCEWVVPEMTFEEYVGLMKQCFDEASTHREVGIFINETKEQQICS